MKNGAEVEDVAMDSSEGEDEADAGDDDESSSEYELD